MLVGVPSHRNPVALQRRAAIRELGLGATGAGNVSTPASARLWLRFVMAEDQADADRDHGDVWLFGLPARRRAKQTYGLEKYLLSNAFLRAAVRWPEAPPLVVLADDDTLFNMTDLS